MFKLSREMKWVCVVRQTGKKFSFGHMLKEMKKKI